ncbi:MAG TPA: DUF1570 domain-containing protein [Anaerohalosphaeraceae bacterium]|jgi:hypothetical protein|nr:DUF1570 domain-containing protein [Anaerohalosphaeraceae bacterium]HRT51239.1 DUF1570 domain-containing protein [Anaerohalosphaeraceae bacterium]HRT87430.1 DUF1570 domain-containing protein [Anaerohalosphaeraceae bacterium]
MRRLTVILLISAVWCSVAVGRPEAVPAVAEDTDAAYFVGKRRIVATDHFTLMHDMRADEAEGIANVLEFAYSEFEACFEAYGFKMHAPEAALEWMCFRKPELLCDYALATENVDLSWLSGYYSSRTNRVAVVRPGRIRKWYGPGRQIAQVAAHVEDGIDAGLVKIVHEAGHQLAFNRGLQRRGVMYPLWATEGLALVFEDCVSDYLPGGRYSEGRKKRLVELYRQGKLIPLDEFAIMPRLSSEHSDVDVYAQAWGFFLFLCEHRNADLQDYFSYLYSLKSGARNAYHLRREFIESFGAIGDLEREWSLFLELAAASKPFLCGPCASTGENSNNLASAHDKEAVVSASLR